MKKFILGSVVFAVAFMFSFNFPQQYVPNQSIFGVSTVEAKRFGGGGFRSSFSSSRSSSIWGKRSGSSSSRSKWGFESKTPNAKPKPTVSAPVSQPRSIDTKKTTTTSSTKSVSTKQNKTFGKTTSLDKKVQQRAASKSVSAVRKETSKFTKKPNAVDTSRTTAYREKYSNVKPVSTTQYYSRRNTYYSSVGWQPSPVVYMSQPSFGAWDALFMWSMLDLHSDMYYHRRNDPAFQEWRREADRLAQDNAELRSKLNRLDTQVSTMEKQGVSVNEEYVPQNVDMGVALSVNVAANTNDASFVMGSGGKLGNYYALCKMIKAEHKETECPNTNGSVENINGIVSGKFDGIIAQANTVMAMEKQGYDIDALQTVAYREVVFLLTNRSADVESVKDIDPSKHTVYAAGSGAASTLVNWGVEDPSDYGYMVQNGKFTGRSISPNSDGLEVLSKNKNGVMFFVCGYKCPLIQLANDKYGDNLVLATVDDWDFNDITDQNGNDVYSFVKLPTSNYENILPRSWGSSDKVETLAVNAVFIVSKEWVQERGADALTKLELSLMPALQSIKERTGDSLLLD